jgi:hypothetical protein
LYTPSLCLLITKASFTPFPSPSCLCSTFTRFYSEVSQAVNDSIVGARDTFILLLFSSFNQKLRERKRNHASLSIFSTPSILSGCFEEDMKGKDETPSRQRSFPPAFVWCNCSPPPPLVVPEERKWVYVSDVVLVVESSDSKLTSFLSSVVRDMWDQDDRDGSW